MKPRKRDRLAYWLEQFGWLHPLLFKRDGTTPSGYERLTNRLNGHLTLGRKVEPIRHQRGR